MVSYVRKIQNSNLTIYDHIDQEDAIYWIPNDDLEALLHNGLNGFLTSGLPNRTRSKVIKQQICKLLGYPIPKSFKKTQPRFPGQNFDVYVQKSNNLQIWNEEVSNERRYVLIKVSDEYRVVRVKVVTGHELAILDTTGVLVQCQMDTGHKKQVTNSSVRMLANIACVDHVPVPISDAVGRKSRIHVGSVCRLV